MGTCRTCDFWHRHRRGAAYGSCYAGKLVQKEPPPPSDGFSFYGHDGFENCAAYFYTGPDFGCIHHEERA